VGDALDGFCPRACKLHLEPEPRDEHPQRKLVNRIVIHDEDGFHVRVSMRTPRPNRRLDTCAWPAVSPARIIVVEDHLDSRVALAYALRSDGHEVVEAEDGLDGTMKLRALLLTNSPPDVIVTDLFMPGVSGLTFAAGARVAGFRAHLIVVTAWPTDGVEEAVARLHAHLFVKPLDMAALRTTVAELALRG
jgi:two-component system cell cycle response regulator CpdR